MVKKVIDPLDQQADDMQVKAFTRMQTILDSARGSIDSEELNDELKTINLAAKMVNNYQLMKRISQSHQIRVFTYITNKDPEQMKKYIEISMPQMIADK